MNKNYYAQLLGILFVILFPFLNSCQQEDILKTNDETPDEYLSKIIKISNDTTGVYLMKDVPLFKTVLQHEFSEHEFFNSEEHNNVLTDLQIVDVINTENRISYSTVVNKGNSTFELLVYTIIEEQEQFIAAEFVSENEIEVFNLSTFTGTAIFKDVHRNIQGTQKFVNGSPDNSSNKQACAWASYEVMCKEGLHWVGEPCAWIGQPGAAHYYTEYMECDNTVLIQFDYGIDGGGSNGNHALPAAQAINNTLTQIGTNYTLSPQQLNFLQSNSNILTGLQNYINNNPNTSGAQFVTWGLNFLMQNAGITGVSWFQFNNWFLNPNVDSNIASETLQYLAESNYVVQNYSNNDYPGMNDSMPFGWWNDNIWMENNIRIDELKPTEVPNATELMLFGIFRKEAVFHIKNSIIALNTAQQLVVNGTYTRIHNGKADAFRHTFWNALSTSDFGAPITLLFTTAHETGASVPNHPDEMTMDLHNNAAGAVIGANYNIFTASNVIQDAVINVMQNTDKVWYLTPLANHDGNNILPNTVIKPTNQ